MNLNLDLLFCLNRELMDFRSGWPTVAVSKMELKLKLELEWECTCTVYTNTAYHINSPLKMEWMENIKQQYV